MFGPTSRAARWGRWTIRCEWLGWHAPQAGSIYSDRVNTKADCRRCGRRIMLDSQGNWFEYHRTQESREDQAAERQEAEGE